MDYARFENFRKSGVRMNLNSIYRNRYTKLMYHTLKGKGLIELVKSRFIDVETLPRKLHLGCGNIKLNGWCNVDIKPTIATDINDDIVLLKKFPDNFADEIYACHVLEHFSHEEVSVVFKNWKRVLKPGGMLRISVPDIDRIVKIYSDNWQHFQTPGHSPWVGLIYGGQGDQYDFHKTGFNFCWAKHLLEGAGFSNVQEYPHYPHFAGDISDASLAKEPFGVYLSLNIVAQK